MRWLIASLLLIPLFSEAQVAFPGAEGFGRSAVGGRGGAVIEVTNLNDSGPGSLREAIGTPGPRTVVFRTGGIIELQEELQITEPYITIAAQTAPGDGVVLKNFGLAVFAHDVIIRGLRVRPAEGLHTQGPDNRDCIAIQDGGQNIMIDHCSFSWGSDENVSIWGSNAHHLSIQWCHLTEALYRGIHPKGPHGMGLLSGNGATNVSAHHNLLAHNNGRNPLFVEGQDLEFCCNTVYDWGYASEFQQGTTSILADVRNNRWKPLTGPVDLGEVPISIDFNAGTANGSLLMIRDNLWPGGPFLTDAQLAAFGPEAAVLPTTSTLSETSSVTLADAATCHTQVLNWAGAIHPQPDATDVRIRTQVQDSTGRKIDCVNATPIELDNGTVISASATTLTYSVLDDAIKNSPEGRQIEIVSGAGAGQLRMGTGVTTIDLPNQIVEATIDQPWTTVPDGTSQFRVVALCTENLGGYPSYASGTPYPDADHDGMPNDWETAQGLDVNDPADRNSTALSADGYTALEVYLNGYYTGGPNGISTLDAMRISIYPNPASESVRIESETESRMAVFDLFGRTILSQPKIKTWDWDLKDANGRTVADGVYLVRMGSAVQRLVISR
jgi:hypothetical protein